MLNDPGEMRRHTVCYAKTMISSQRLHLTSTSGRECIARIPAAKALIRAILKRPKPPVFRQGFIKLTLTTRGARKQQLAPPLLNTPDELRGIEPEDVTK